MPAPALCSGRAAANAGFHSSAAPVGESTAAGVGAAGIESFLGGLDSTTGRPCSTGCAVGFTPPAPRLGPGAPLPAVPMLLLLPSGGGGVSLTPEAAPNTLDQVLSMHPAAGKIVPWQQTDPTAVLCACTRAIF